jgi:hypothetical protein
MVEGEHTKDSLLALPAPSTPPRVRNTRARSASAKKPPVTITPKSSAAKGHIQRKESPKATEMPKSTSSRKRKLSSSAFKEKEKEEVEEEVFYPDYAFENYDVPLDASYLPVEGRHEETATASAKKSSSVLQPKKVISGDELSADTDRQPLKKLKTIKPPIKPQEPKNKETNESKRADTESKSIISTSLSAVKENIENMNSAVKGMDERSDDIENWVSPQEVPLKEKVSKLKPQQAKPVKDPKKDDRQRTPVVLETSFSALETTITRYPSSDKKGYSESHEESLFPKLEATVMDADRNAEPMEPVVAAVETNLPSSHRNVPVSSASYVGTGSAEVSTDKQVGALFAHYSPFPCF